MHEIEGSLARLDAAINHQYREILDRLYDSKLQQPSASPLTSPYQNRAASSLSQLHVADVVIEVSIFHLAITVFELYLPDQSTKDGGPGTRGGNEPMFGSWAAVSSQGSKKSGKSKGRNHWSLRTMMGRP